MRLGLKILAGWAIFNWIQNGWTEGSGSVSFFGSFMIGLLFMLIANPIKIGLKWLLIGMGIVSDAMWFLVLPLWLLFGNMLILMLCCVMTGNGAVIGQLGFGGLCVMTGMMSLTSQAFTLDGSLI